MTAIKKCLFLLAGMFAALIVNPALAQGPADIAGAWHGAISTPQTDVTLVLRVTRGDDGMLAATIENFDQNPGNEAAVTEIAVIGGHLAFKVAAAKAAYEGDWDEASQQWKGTLNQGGALPLNLAEGAPAPKPVIAGLDGVWEGTIERNSVKLRQALRIRTTGHGTFALYDSPDQMVLGLPVSDLARDGQMVSLSTWRGLAKFSGTLSEDGKELAGTWMVPNQPDITMTFTKGRDLAQRQPPARPQTPKEPFPYRAEEVAFDNPAFGDVHLAGTLTLPEGDGPFPAAIMITGSGAQDRDETLLEHKPFAVIADHLTRHGIAVLRFDDRGVGKSTGDYAAATSADLATDANAAFAYLKSRGDIRSDAIGFIGHSEGGMIGPIAMADNPGVAFYISLAGPGTNLDKLMLSQQRLLTTQMGLSQAEIDRREPIMAAMFKAIKDADTPDAGFDAAMAVLTPEAKVMLGLPAEADGAPIVRQISGPWFSYFLKYDPVPNLARIRVPVLALNGSLDLQVPAKENLPAIREALKDNPDVTIVELPGLNHLFQTATTGGVGEYRDIEETFAPAALNLMSDWISQRFVTK